MKWLRRTAAEDSIDREIVFHVDAMIAAKVEAGIPEREARRLALIEFGGREQVKQSVREVHVSAVFESMRANFRSSLRFMRRAPGFSLTIVLTLALGIGANSAVFSAIDAIVLRPLPFPHAEELVRVHQMQTGDKQPEYFVAPSRVEDWNRMNSTFRSISGYYTGDATLTAGAYPEKISVAFVAPRFLELWGIAPHLGRDFAENEQKFGGPNAVLVTERFWKRYLHADPTAVGKPIQLSGSSYTVVGVMPQSFRFQDRDVDVWEPSPMDAPYAQSRTSTWFTVLGRMKPGVTLVQAQADLATVQAQLGRQFPETDAKLRVELEPLKHVVLHGVEESLWLFYGWVSLLLMIACTNIAALLMARTAEREHEIAIRYSLGATRRAVVGQLLSEVLIVAVIGATAGLGLAAMASRVFMHFSKDLPRLDEITLNWRVVVYSLACAMAATLVSGLIPAIKGTRRNLSGALLLASRTQVSGRNGGQWMLVGVQVALAVTLLIGSGLLLRSLQALGRVDPGFEAVHVLTLRISAGWGETTDMGKLVSRIDRTLDAMRAIPGVEAAATTSTIPGNSYSYLQEFHIRDAGRDPTMKTLAETRWVSSGYFAALHIPVLQGTGCGEELPAGAMGPMDRRVVVNRSFAEEYFPQGGIVGHHLQTAESNGLTKPGEIRGVVGDAREEGMERAVQPTVYWCFSAPTPDPYYLIRVHGEPMAMVNALQRRIHELEPGRSVFSVMPLEDYMQERQADSRLRTTLLTLFALTATALVALGLFGTMSYLGRTRRREVGLRLALGALPSQLVRHFMGQGLRVTFAGGVIGLVLGAMTARMLGGMLYGVSAMDWVTYAAVFGLTMMIACGACLVPSLRVVRVDPTEMLREE